jgi:hypothetical protein
MLFPNGTELRSLCSRPLLCRPKIGYRGVYRNPSLLPTRSPQWNAEAVAEAAQAKVFAQACYYSSLSQPGALPVSGLNSGSKGFSTICYGVGRSRIGTNETTRRTRCIDRLEWLRVSSHFCRVIPKYTRLTALI